MVTRLNYVGPMLTFDGSHSRASTLPVTHC